MAAESNGRPGTSSDEMVTPEAGEKIEQDAGEQVVGSRAPLFVKRYRTLHITWQVGVFLVGVAIIAAGVAMLVLPGPGWIAIFLGLAVMATEFVWAQRVLRWSKQQATKAASKALDPRTRRRNMLFLIAGIILIAAGAAIYVQQRGMPSW